MALAYVILVLVFNLALGYYLGTVYVRGGDLTLPRPCLPGWWRLHRRGAA